MICMTNEEFDEAIPDKFASLSVPDPSLPAIGTPGARFGAEIRHSHFGLGDEGVFAYLLAGR